MVCKKQTQLERLNEGMQQLLNEAQEVDRDLMDYSERKIEM